MQRPAYMSSHQQTSAVICLIPISFSLPYARHHVEPAQAGSSERNNLRTTAYISIHLPNSQGRISGVIVVPGSTHKEPV